MMAWVWQFLAINMMVVMMFGVIWIRFKALVKKYGLSESNTFEISYKTIHNWDLDCFACLIKFWRVLFGKIVRLPGISAQLRGDKSW